VAADNKKKAAVNREVAAVNCKGAAVIERRLQSRREKAGVYRRVVGYEQKGVSLNGERQSG
jgi:hypothetical protein